MAFLDSIFGSPPSIPKPQQPPSLSNLLTQQQKSNNLAFGQGALDTSGPFGSVEYRHENGVPVGVKTNLSPQVQGVLNPLFSNAATLAGGLTPGAWSPEQDKFATSIYNSQLGFMQPGWDRELNQLNVQAAERGLPLGSEARGGLFAPALEAQNLARTQAANTAAIAGENLPYQHLGQTLGAINQVPMPQGMSPLTAPQPVNSSNIALSQYGLGNQANQQYYQNQQNQYAQNQAALGNVLGTAATLPFLF